MFRIIIDPKKYEFSYADRPVNNSFIHGTIAVERASFFQELETIELCSKAWFPYDRPDRPDRPSRLKKMLRRPGRSYGNAIQTIANDPDD